MDYTSEAFYAVEIINYAGTYNKLAGLLRNDTVNEATLQTEAERLLKNSEGYFSKYSAKIDRELFATMLKIYSDKVSKELQSEYFKQQVAAYKNDFNAMADAMFKKSVFASESKVKKMLTQFNANKGKKLMRDPVFKLYEEVSVLYNEQITNAVNPINEKINILMRSYMTAQRKMQPTKDFYPDANLSLRIAYGTVDGYTAKDAVYYTYQTTDKGIEEKYMPGDEDFDYPPALMDLLHKNNFGKYADANGNLPVAFLASNHTTGGNSGSPVINANGELIGVNYDRVWEGTMSDVMYDIDRCRNIALDMRYVLFMVETYAGAKNIMQELWVVE